MRRVIKIVATVVGLLVVLMILYSFWLPSPDTTEEPTAAERDSMQTTIDAFMVDNHLAEVTPSTSGAGGEKINGKGTQIHANLSLQPYMRDAVSAYCYRWQSDGRIIFQYDVNADGNCAIDADQLFP